MNAIKESYTNRQIPQNYKKLIVINPVYMNKTVMKLFGNEPKYRITYHCQVIILILILFYHFKKQILYHFLCIKLNFNSTVWKILEQKAKELLNMDKS